MRERIPHPKLAKARERLAAIEEELTEALEDVRMTSTPAFGVMVTDYSAMQDIRIAMRDLISSLQKALGEAHRLSEFALANKLKKGEG